MLTIMIFLDCKMLFHSKGSWVKCCFYHLKKNVILKLMKNGVLLSNKVFSITFIKLLVYIYTKTQL